MPVSAAAPGGGIEVYVHNLPLKASVAWQQALYNALISGTGLKGNRANPMQKANLHEVREPHMPSVLLELGFMDSKTDVPLILSEKYADQCAGAIVKVIAERGRLKKKGNGHKTQTHSVDSAKSYNPKKAGNYVVNAADGVLNLRTGADASKQLIEAMDTGSVVHCYGYYTNEWLLVISDTGNVGFCNSKYLIKK